MFACVCVQDIRVAFLEEIAEFTVLGHDHRMVGGRVEYLETLGYKLRGLGGEVCRYYLYGIFAELFPPW